jgi:hypothetical protein
MKDKTNITFHISVIICTYRGRRKKNKTGNRKEWIGEIFTK